MTGTVATRRSARLQRAVIEEGSEPREDSEVAVAKISSSAPTKSTPKPAKKIVIKEEPKFPYAKRNNLPVSREPPDISLLTGNMTILESKTLAYSLEQSRTVWLEGSMFDKFWTRPQRGKKLASGEVNAKDKMTKLCDCHLVMGPHVFEVKLFLVKDESGDEKQPAQEDIKMAPLLLKQEERQAMMERRDLENSQAPHGSSVQSSPQERLSSEPDPNKKANTNGNQAQRKPEGLKPQGTPPTGSKPTDSTGTSVGSSQTGDDKPAEPEKPRRGRKPGTGKKQKLAAERAAAERSGGPRPPDAEPINSPSNQATIARLQAMARLDPALTSLMRIVATGSASDTQIAHFQEYINQAREMDIAQRAAAAQALAAKSNKPAKSKVLAAAKKPRGPYTPKKQAFRHSLIVFEYKENPADRFILPKESIVEVLENGTILVSFLLVHNRQEILSDLQSRAKAVAKDTKGKGKGNANEEDVSKEKEQEGQQHTENDSAQEQSSNSSQGDAQNQSSSAGPETLEELPKSPSALMEPKRVLYTPFTMMLHGVPLKSAPFVERSVILRQIVFDRMQGALKEGTRAGDEYVWYQIDREDTELQEALKVPPKPLATYRVPVKRKEYKPRQKKEDKEKRVRLEGDQDQENDDQTEESKESRVESKEGEVSQESKKDAAESSSQPARGQDHDGDVEMAE